MPYREERLSAPSVMDTPCDVCGDGRVMLEAAEMIFVAGNNILALRYKCQRCGCVGHVHPCNAGDKALKRIAR